VGALQCITVERLKVGSDEGDAFVTLSTGKANKSICELCCRVQAPGGLAPPRRFVRLAMIGVMAALHLAVVTSLLSQYYSPPTLISMHITDEEVGRPQGVAPVSVRGLQIVMSILATPGSLGLSDNPRNPCAGLSCSASTAALTGTWAFTAKCSLGHPKGLTTSHTGAQRQPSGGATVH